MLQPPGRLVVPPSGHDRLGMAREQTGQRERQKRLGARHPDAPIHIDRLDQGVPQSSSINEVADQADLAASSRISDHVPMPLPVRQP